MTQTLIPNSTTSNSWTLQGDTSAHLCIDETIASADGDTTYIQNNTVNNTSIVGLSAGTDPLTASGHKIRVRANRQLSGTGAGCLIELRQGTTVIASFTPTLGIGSAYTTFEYTLTAAEANSITDYTNLNLRFTCLAAVRPRVTAAEFQIPSDSFHVSKEFVEVLAGATELRSTKSSIEVLSFLGHPRITKESLEVLATAVQERFTKERIEALAAVSTERFTKQRTEILAEVVKERFSKSGVEVLAIVPATSARFSKSRVEILSAAFNPRVTKQRVEVLAIAQTAKHRLGKQRIEVLASTAFTYANRITKNGIEVLASYIQVDNSLLITRNAVEVLRQYEQSITDYHLSKILAEVLARYETIPVIPISLPSVLPAFLIANWKGGGGTVETSYQTDITRGVVPGTEERKSLWDRPVRVQNVKLTARDIEEASQLYMNVLRLSQERLPIPLYSDFAKVTADSSGTIIYCDTRYKRLFPNARILIHTWEHLNRPVDPLIRDIAAVFPDRIVLKSSLDKTYPARSRVFPLMDAEVKLTGSVHLISDEIFEVDLETTEVVGPSSLPPSRVTEPEDVPYYNGRPILDIDPNWAEGFTSEIVRDGEQITEGRGSTIQLDGPSPRLRHTLTFQTLDRAMFWKLLGYFDSRLGSAKSFYVVNPATLFEVLSLDSSYVIIKDFGDVNNVRDFIDHIALVSRGKAPIIRKISSVIDLGTGWKIFFDKPIDLTYFVGVKRGRITSAHLVRLDSDAMTENWNTDNKVKISWTMIDTQNEESVEIENLDFYLKDKLYGPPQEVANLYAWFSGNKNVWQGFDNGSSPATIRDVNADPFIKDRADFVDDVRVDPRIYAEGRPVTKPYCRRLAPTDSKDGPRVIQFDSFHLLGGQWALEFNASGGGSAQLTMDDDGLPFYSNKNGLTIFFSGCLKRTGIFKFFWNDSLLQWRHDRITMREGSDGTLKTLDTPDLRKKSPNIYTLRWNPGLSISVYRNGIQKALSTNPAIVCSSIDDSYLGVDPTYICQFEATEAEKQSRPGPNGIMSEFLIFQRSLGNADMNTIGRYLAKKSSASWETVV